MVQEFGQDTVDSTCLCYCQDLQLEDVEAGELNHLKNHLLTCLAADAGIGLGASVPLHVDLSTWTLQMSFLTA